MEKILIGVLIITSLCSFSAKHVFIQNPLHWSAALRYCREHHTDLSPITNEVEETVFRESVGENKTGWIGLYCRGTKQTWRWSGGSNATSESRVTNFLVGVKWTSGGWFPTFGWKRNTFFCLNLIMVKEKKSWSEALDHCRRSHTDLTSLLSTSEDLLAQTEVQQSGTTEGVWIGLRYWQGSWGWANGDPLEYEAWTHGDQDHLSPTQRLCGVLTKEGAWVNSDCQDRRHFICV